MNCLVTVSIASYNNAPYIERCIDSVINQTYDKIEVIIVDDGSTDDTLSLLHKYECNRCLRIIKKENEGLSSVRQRALDEAKGTYVCFIDADDYLNDTYVESMLTKLITDGSDICVCSTSFEDEIGKILEVGTSSFACIESKEAEKVTPKTLSTFYHDVQRKYKLSDSWNKLYRKSFVTDTGVKFQMPKGLNGTDTLFNFMISLHSPIYSTVSDCCYHHVMYNSSSVHRKNKNLFDTFMILTKKMFEESIKIGCYPQIRRTLEVEYFTYLRMAFDDIYVSSVGCVDYYYRCKILMNKHRQFCNDYNIRDCKVSEMPTQSLKVFLFLFKKSVLALPVYFYLQKVLLKVTKRNIHKN